jgi:hypothetical protein
MGTIDIARATWRRVRVATRVTCHSILILG